MADPAITTETPETAVEEWFELFGGYVAAEDFSTARALVADDVVSFGTKAELVRGLDHLVERQWTEIWPNVEDFTFEEVTARGEGDRAWGGATWTSTGFDDDGQSFHRPGRATITFERRDGQWLAVHTHFSLFPGTPQQTFGPAGAQE